MRWSRTEEAGPCKISQPFGMRGYIICHLDIGYAYIFRRRQTDRYIGGLMKGWGGVVSPRMAGNAGDSHLPPPELKSLRWVDRTAPRRAWSVALVTRSYLVLGERGVLPRLRITPRQGFCGEKPIWKRKATRIELRMSRAVKFFKCSSGLTSFSSIREVVLFTFFPSLMYLKPSMLSRYVVHRSDSCDTQSLPQITGPSHRDSEGESSNLLVRSPSRRSRPPHMMKAMLLSVKWAVTRDSEVESCWWQLESGLGFDMSFLYHCEVAIIKNEIETSIWFNEAKY